MPKKIKHGVAGPNKPSGIPIRKPPRIGGRGK